MKNIIKTLVVVMVIVLALAAFTACDLNPQPTTPPACEHTGGTATCENAAVCEKCGESYGEKADILSLQWTAKKLHVLKTVLQKVNTAQYVWKLSFHRK